MIRRPRQAPVQSVVLVSKLGSEEGPRIAGALGSWLRARSVQVVFDHETASALGEDNGAEREALPTDADLAVVVGGDGTLLSVARSAGPRKLPVLGINFGSLGFLTELQPDEMHQGLERVLRGDYSLEERQTLRVRRLRSGAEVEEHAVLNDAVVNKSALARMLTIAVSIDRQSIGTYTADGLIVSTATGSTAYNLSAGGPILDPRMRAFVLSPICPFTMTYRPLVVPGSVSIELTVPDADEVYLTLDGQLGFPMAEDERLVIDAHPDPVQLVRVSGLGFFDVLQKKLRWGAR